HEPLVPCDAGQGDEASAVGGVVRGLVVGGVLKGRIEYAVEGAHLRIVDLAVRAVPHTTDGDAGRRLWWHVVGPEVAPHPRVPFDEREPGTLKQVDVLPLGGNGARPNGEAGSPRLAGPFGDAGKHQVE